MIIHNYSRHDFNADQAEALRQLFGEEAELGGAEAPFFTGVGDFVAKVGGKVASAVLPGDILRDAWANQLDGDGGSIPPGTTLIGWRTDQAARKRGRFAVRGVVVHEWQRTVFVDGPRQQVGEQETWGSVVMPVRIKELEIEPTVENDFRTGEEFEYEGDGGNG